jgi:lipopolysaccharide export system protein LptC
MSTMSESSWPTPIQRWRRRSRVIRGLRIALPATIGVILAGLGALVVENALRGPRSPPGSVGDPIRMVKAHFVGRDTHGRPYVLTSMTATRDPKEYQRVILDHPVLVLDVAGQKPVRITAGAGVFHQDTGKLEVSQGVRFSNVDETFDTAQSLFDTKTGELVGSDPVQGAGALGQIQAKTYGVYDQGGNAVFKGDVHTVMIPKHAAPATEAQTDTGSH